MEQERLGRQEPLMRLRIEELPPKGRRVELDDSPAWAVTAVAQALEGEVEALGGSLRVRTVGNGVTVSGDAFAVVCRPCDRCLTTLRLRLEGEVDLYFDSGRLEGATEVGLEAADLDVGFVEDGVLDLAAALVEFFLLESPSRLRCDDPQVSRAEPGPCELPGSGGEGEERVDPRLAALKNFSSS
jgi:uncharacterized metal-binding protein YceD (DUF177 family)